MSYTFLQEQGEESSAECFSDIPASVLSRLNLTAGKSYSSGSETESCQPSQSGMMLQPSTDAHGVDTLTLSPADSLARTFRQPAKAPGSLGIDPDYGDQWLASFAKLDRATSSWRIPHCLPLVGLDAFSATWPRWGTMHDGECYPLPMPFGLVALRAWITYASESGSSQRNPSPTASMMTSADMEQAKFSGNDPRRPTYQQAKRLPTLHGFSKDGKSNGPSGNELGRAVNRLPSVRKSDADRGGRGDLIQAVRGNENKHFKRLPTTRTASKSGGGIGLDGGTGSQEMITAALGEQAAKDLTGGSLNPPWVEWLMGWPIEWTALQPLEMGKFLQWQLSHGEF